MSRMIIVDAAEEVACPQCAHAFALPEGISRHAIELRVRGQRHVWGQVPNLKSESAREAVTRRWRTMRRCDGNA